LIDTIIALLERNADSINQCVQVYQPDRNLCVLKGMRNTLPLDAYPSLEIEPTSGSNQWGTVRAQRPRYSLQMTLTTRTNNVKLHVEYITTIATRLAEILTSPENLQLQVLNETKWTAYNGLVNTYLLDSLVENVNYNSQYEGTIRVCEFDWFALINETYPDGKWKIGDTNSPTVLRPKIIT
jgi:hypothetical protein